MSSSPMKAQGRGKLEKHPEVLFAEPVLARSSSALGKYTIDDAQS